MTYSTPIRKKLLATGWDVSEIAAHGLYTVTVTNGDQTHGATAEIKTVAYLEVERSIREAS